MAFARDGCTDRIKTMAFAGRLYDRPDRIREAGPFPLVRVDAIASVLRPTGHNQLADHVHRTQSRPDAIRDDTGAGQLSVQTEELLPDCVRFSCYSPLASASTAAPGPDCGIHFNYCSLFASAAAPRSRLLLTACTRFSCCSRSRPLRLLLPDCFNCCSPITMVADRGNPKRAPDARYPMHVG